MRGMARVVAPEVAYHVIQRGVRSMDVFWKRVLCPGISKGVMSRDIRDIPGISCRDILYIPVIYSRDSYTVTTTYT